MTHSKMAPLGVHFGNGPRVLEKDPYFGGVGPDRRGCQQCGGYIDKFFNGDDPKSSAL